MDLKLSNTNIIEYACVHACISDGCVHYCLEPGGVLLGNHSQ